MKLAAASYGEFTLVKSSVLILVEALGIEPRSEKEHHPASTCLAHRSILKVKSPMGRSFTSSLRICFIS